MKRFSSTDFLLPSFYTNQYFDVYDRQPFNQVLFARCLSVYCELHMPAVGHKLLQCRYTCLSSKYVFL